LEILELLAHGDGHVGFSVLFLGILAEHSVAEVKNGIVPILKGVLNLVRFSFLNNLSPKHCKI